MGADDEGKEPIADDQDNDEGYKTGTSTPGYRHADGESFPNPYVVFFSRGWAEL